MTTKAELFQVEGEHTGLLVAVWLDPALAEALALPGGEPADQLHLTLCYCGDANEMSDVQIGRAIAAAADIATMYGPLSGQLAGLGRFNASESSDGKDVIYANVDVPMLEALRQYLAVHLDMAGCRPLMNHGYTPHVTLAYIDEGAPWPIERLITQPLTIRSLWVSVGDKRTEIPLVGSWGINGVIKAGARHSRRDTVMLQTMHDHAVALGASCGGKAVKATGGEGNALKAVGKTDDELRVANYMVLFGGRDLEGIANHRRNADGSRGEYFSARTDFKSAYTDIGVLYVDWEHGAAPAGEPDADEVLGVVDWKTARIDDRGLFVERVLNRRNRYVQFLEELIDEGLIGNSTEAVGGAVEKTATGEIVRWPLRRDTLTVQPMEPRMLTANAVAALKALSESHPALLTIVELAERHAPEAATPEAGGNPAADAERERLLLELDLLTLEMTN